jgi:hypothetical protein
MKLTAFAIFILLFFTISAHSQYLEPKDIDIYINGVKEISDFVAVKGKTHMEYVKYLTNVYMLFSVFYTIISEDYLTDEELSKNKDIFNTFLNSKIEDEYEKLFRKIG